MAKQKGTNRIVVVAVAARFNAWERRVREAAHGVLRAMHVHNRTLEIYLVGGSFMKKNVLAFPAPLSFPRPDIQKKIIGEVYLNPLYISAHRQNLIQMLVHGIVHCMGYDHVTHKDWKAMDKKERYILKKLDASSL